MTSNLYLTDAQFLRALERMRAHIEASETKLRYVDSTTVGEKYTDCSWGMCTNDPSFWAKDELLFPERGPIRVGCTANGDPILHESSKYFQDGQQCPFDRREGTEDRKSWGCFYHCRIFSDKEKRPGREEALARYDVTIDRLRKRVSP